MATSRKRLQRIVSAFLALFFMLPFLLFFGTSVHAKTKTVHYLFIGNSLTGYNNQPEMFKRIVKAGRGTNVKVHTLLRGDRTLSAHAKAIEIAERTAGDTSLLTDEEKTYFYTFKTTTFSEKMYRGYVNCVWDTKTKKKKQYDAIVLQTYFRNGDGDTKADQTADALEEIIQAFQNPKTKYVVESFISWYNSRKQFFANQDTGDSITRKAVVTARKKTKGLYKKIKIAYCGRALCNYLSWYGKKYARRREKQAFQCYKNPRVFNDVLRGDKVHLTHFGTYITANTLYSAIYGNPAKASKKYKGGVKKISKSADGTYLDERPRAAIIYNKGRGFKNKEVIKGAVEVSYITQKSLPQK